MKRPPHPDKRLRRAYYHAISRMAGVVGVVMAEDVNCERLDTLGERIYEAHARVRGNRPESWEPSWEDLRLATVAVLREMLTALEEGLCE